MNNEFVNGRESSKEGDFNFDDWEASSDKAQVEIEINGWQYQIGFLKQGDADGNPYKVAHIAAIESGGVSCIVPCGNGVIFFSKNSDDDYVPMSYLEESLEGDGNLWLYVNPIFRKAFSIWDLDLLMYGLSEQSDSRPLGWEFSRAMKRAACSKARTSTLP